MNPYLSIVVPLYNEEESVDALTHRIDKVISGFDFESEVLLIDDGSTDATWLKIEELKKQIDRIKGIRFNRNYGQTSAMVAGFNQAAGEVIVTLDGDLQNDPADIAILLDVLDQGYDIVSGWRKDRQDAFSRVLPSKIANMIISVTTGVRLHDYGCSLKAYRAHCVKSLNAYGEMHRFFPALASMTGARVTEIPVKHYAREFGSSKYGMDRIFKVFSDIFAMNLIIRFSSTPLRGFGTLSLPFAVLTTLFLVLAVLALIYDWAAGKALFFFIATALFGMGFLNIIGLGIIGELIVNTSDLSHTQLPELTQKEIKVKIK